MGKLVTFSALILHVVMQELLNAKFCVQMRGLTKYSSLVLVLWIGALTLYMGLQSYGLSKINVPESQELTNQNTSPLIFIGGLPRSGTTLARVMLDAHPDVRCGEETRVVPRILRTRMEWTNSQKERSRLAEAGMSEKVLDSAVSAFISKIIENHGEPASWLCNKDPFTMKYSIYLSKLFPNAKFILMLRDGRAVVNSIITRRVTVSGFDFRDPKKCLERWNSVIESMYDQCLHIGPDRCMPVYYEQLSLYPDLWMHRILEFLGIPWSNNVLHHQDFIGKPGGASLSQWVKYWFIFKSNKFKIVWL